LSLNNLLISVTTIKPEIGLMEFEDHRRISLADLPGIIEGAHRNEVSNICSINYLTIAPSIRDVVTCF